MDLGNRGCLWSWGSPRLIGEVPEPKDAQNGVSLEREKRRKKNKNVEEKKKK